MTQYIPHVPTQEEQETVEKIIKLFGQLQIARSQYAMHCEEVARLIAPEYKNTFFYGSMNYPGNAKRAQEQIDATGAGALQRFKAIVDSLLTPGNSRWHELGTSNPYLNKSRRVRLWFEQATEILFAQRYSPTAAFMQNNQACHLALGAFGTAGLFIDELDDPLNRTRGLRYRAIPPGELFLIRDHQGIVVGFMRWFQMTAAQALSMFGEDKFPEALRAALEAESQTPHHFLHHCALREDWEPARLDYKGKPYCSDYVSLTGTALLHQGGYRGFPLSTATYSMGPGEIYGRSPAMQILPSLKLSNALKATALKAGHRAVDPVLLTADDGLVSSVDLRPGAINPGGVSPDGRPLVHALPVGDHRISKDMMDEERQIINDSFLISLFQILVDTPAMTAHEVMERTAEKSILLAPSIGQLQAQYLGPMIERELDILSHLRILPKMPDELREADGEYEVIYTSPLAKRAKAQEASGFMRAIESAMTIVNATQDSSVLDNFAFDTAIPQISAILSVPESWMASPQEVAQKRKARAQTQARQQQIQAMPAQVAMQKNQLAAQQQARKGNQPAVQGAP